MLDLIFGTFLAAIVFGILGAFLAPCGEKAKGFWIGIAGWGVAILAITAVAFIATGLEKLVAK